jgi:hypothetical protein
MQPQPQQPRANLLTDNDLRCVSTADSGLGGFCVQNTTTVRHLSFDEATPTSHQAVTCSTCAEELARIVASGPKVSIFRFNSSPTRLLRSNFDCNALPRAQNARNVIGGKRAHSSQKRQQLTHSWPCAGHCHTQAFSTWILKQ